MRLNLMTMTNCKLFTADMNFYGTLTQRGRRKWEVHGFQQHSQVDQEDQQGRWVPCLQAFPVIKHKRCLTWEWFSYNIIKGVCEWWLSCTSPTLPKEVSLTVSPFGPKDPWGPDRPLSPFSPCSPGGPMRPIRPGCPFSPLAPGSPRRPGKPGGPCRTRRRERGGEEWGDEKSQSASRHENKRALLFYNRSRWSLLSSWSWRSLLTLKQ